MPILDTRYKPRESRESERGNIVLVAALLVLTFGLTGIGLARMVQSRMESDADIRFSNYAATLAINVAESAINHLVYNWNRNLGIGTNGASGVGDFSAFPAFSTTYPGVGGDVHSTSNFTLTVTGGGPYAVSAKATVTADGPILPNQSFRSISRTVDATVSLVSGQYVVTEYAR